MARVRLTTKAGARAQTLAGAVVIRSYRGQIIAQKWPRKRGKPKPGPVLENSRWFTAARKYAKYRPAKEQNAAREAAAGTPLLPHDLIMSAMAGRLLSISGRGEPYYRSFRAMTDVSDSLDIITNIPGQTLVRGDDQWIGVDGSGGGANWVLSHNPSQFYSGTSGSSYAFKGAYLTPQVQMAVTDLMFSAQFTSGGTYRIAFGKADGSDVITEVTLSDPVTAGLTGRYMMVFPFAFSMEANQQYFIMLGRTDAGNTFSLSVSFRDGPSWMAPITNQGGIRLAKVTPAVGDTINQPVSDTVPMALNAFF